MEIRKVEIQDIKNNEKELKILFKEMLELKFGKCESKIEEVYKNMEKFIEDGSAIIIGAFEDNRILGFIWCYEIRKKTYHINYFAVDENYRSLGIGQKLLDQLYEIAKENKIELLELLVEASNSKAIKKYKNNEFTEKYIKMEKQIGECND